jgi:hypothetical protein
MRTVAVEDLQSLIDLCSLTGTKKEKEKDLDEFILRARRLAPSGLSDDSLDALHILAKKIGIDQGLMSLVLKGSVEAVRREDGEMVYSARPEAAESRAS